MIHCRHVGIVKLLFARGGQNRCTPVKTVLGPEADIPLTINESAIWTINVGTPLDGKYRCDQHKNRPKLAACQSLRDDIGVTNEGYDSKSSDQEA